MVTDPPQVNERGHYSVSQAKALLGISHQKLYRAMALGARQGGIDYKVRADNGRRQISGKEIIRYWRG